MAGAFAKAIPILAEEGLSLMGNASGGLQGLETGLAPGLGGVSQGAQDAMDPLSGLGAPSAQGGLMDYQGLMDAPAQGSTQNLADHEAFVNQILAKGMQAEESPYANMSLMSLMGGLNGQ